MSQELDSSVLSAIRSGKNKFSDLLMATNAQQNQLDRSLQRLRKRGQATFKASTGWSAPQQQDAAQAHAG